MNAFLFGQSVGEKFAADAMAEYAQRLRDQGVQKVTWADRGAGGLTLQNITYGAPKPATPAAPAPVKPATPAAAPVKPVAPVQQKPVAPAIPVTTRKTRSAF